MKWVEAWICVGGDRGLQGKAEIAARQQDRRVDHEIREDASGD